jgi:hypothetical protein
MTHSWAWAVIPAVGYCLLSLDEWADPVRRGCAWLVERLGRAGATW